ncbi:MAG: ral secretion pathway protein [Hydrocarboniphaga sp.]|uniref:type II secretion system minor pseudopilin GspJ n=1 Tax=Hydrocarboniphaga sp. TaxID=2033016 RepID=UPI00262107D7|nr:type II secretion system minor pseudopilin GspJ [Hydrocarboniphaga sp.]MDB5968068.1 ral secretion pathway protein [Hydrocarboniphaga sp.]
MNRVGVTPPRRHQGFTLIEIILVVLIFGIMSAMAYGGLNSVLKTRTAVEASIERTADLQRAYMRMRNDFQNLALRPIRDNFGDPQPALLGSRDNIVEFTRGGWRNPLYLPRSSFERVVYRLTDHKLERASYRVLDRAQDSQPARVTLLDRVDDFKLRYMDEQREWVTEWAATASRNQPQTTQGSTEKPPLAIELTLVTKDMGELRFVFKPGSEPTPAGANVPPPTTGSSTGIGSGSNDDDSDKDTPGTQTPTNPDDE